MINRKLLLRSLFFIVLTIVIMSYVVEVFDYPDSAKSKQIMNTFYNEPQNTLDGVCIGTSSTHCAWIAPLAYKERGIAISSIATDSQPLVLIKYLIEEVEKTQSPRVYVIELKWNKTPDNISETGIRRVTDSMPQSLTRIKAISAAIDYAAKGENDVICNEKIAYYLPIIKYHSRWNEELNKEDFLLTKIENDYKGFWIDSRTTYNIVPQDEPSYLIDSKKINIDMEKTIIDLLKYCETIDADILFVIPPMSIGHNEELQLNYIVNLIEDKGYDIINFCDKKNISAARIDYNTDFYDPNHLNYLGAKKYTQYLSKFISDKYVLTDHRGQVGYESWEKAYMRYFEKIAERVN